MTPARGLEPPRGQAPAPRRTPILIRPDACRVVARLFLPGQEGAAPGTSRAAAVIERCQALGDEEVEGLLAEIVEGHGDRHRRLPQILDAHFASIAHRIDDPGHLSPARRQLIGAYFTQEYALEGAALFNPSIVAHPDQDVPPGDLRLVMSARAVGEGHLSSLVFRTGVLSPHGEQGPTVTMDAPSRFAETGVPRTALIDGVRLAHEAAVAGVDAESLGFVLEGMPPQFTTKDLDVALQRLSAQGLTRIHTRETAERLRTLAERWYEVEFAEPTRMSERVLMPQIPVESHGIEDARFVRFAEDDGTATTYLATYTAFDGEHIQVRRLETADFRVFRSSTLTGRAATNKGMALFPRRVAGRYLALSRWDRENTAVAFSDDGHHWPESTVVQTPLHAWELVQLGNCGSPIETPAGWLVLTHGVGPIRNYAIGALLLDLDDPTRVIGRLRRPLLTPADDERDGYVPNVVYSCGALLHGPTLVLPYGCSDSQIRIVLLDLPTVLDLLTSG
jgi:predicted GH43/DUF377 family glycosyl hydrolase